MAWEVFLKVPDQLTELWTMRRSQLSTGINIIHYGVPNSHLTCFQRGFIAQSVEHRTGIAEVMDSNPVEASDFFFLGSLCNCLSCFITARITSRCVHFELAISA